MNAKNERTKRHMISYYRVHYTRINTGTQRAEGDRQVLYTSAVHKNLYFRAAGDGQAFPTRERYRVLGDWIVLQIMSGDLGSE